MLLFHITRLISWLFSLIYFRITFRGIENVPRSGPVILAPNHVSFLDPIWASLPLQRPASYMTWERFIHMPVLGWLIRLYGGFPVRLEKGDRAALREAARQLQAGGQLMIFPEGGRTRTGKIMPFKPGFIHLALETHAPIVPVTILGGYNALAPHHRFPRPAKVTIIYHPPIHLTPPENSEDLKEYLHQQAAWVRSIIAASLPAQSAAAQVQVER